MPSLKNDALIFLEIFLIECCAALGLGLGITPKVPTWTLLLSSADRAIVSSENISGSSPTKFTGADVW